MEKAGNGFNPSAPGVTSYVALGVSQRSRCSPPDSRGKTRTRPHKPVRLPGLTARVQASGKPVSLANPKNLFGVLTYAIPQEQT